MREVMSNGDIILSYNKDCFDYTLFYDDVEGLLGKENYLLKVSEECADTEEDLNLVLCTGESALEQFYKSLGIIVVEGKEIYSFLYLNQSKEFTNFYYRLCLE